MVAQSRGQVAPLRKQGAPDRPVDDRRADIVARIAEEIGFKGVMSGPLVRSSYRAGRLWAQAMKRWGRPEEVADAVAFLCSPTATSMTGTSLVLDGGWTAH